MSGFVHVVCPQCDAVNRVPADRLSRHAKCGVCHEALFAGMPLAVDGMRLRKHVARNDVPVLVDFWAPWCGPCKYMAPIFQQAAGSMEPGLRFVKLDTEDEPAISSEFGIRSIPTLVLFRGGVEHARIAGAMDLANLTAWVRQHLQ